MDAAAAPGALCGCQQAEPLRTCMLTVAPSFPLLLCEQDAAVPGVMRRAARCRHESQVVCVCRWAVGHWGDPSSNHGMCGDGGGGHRCVEGLALAAALQGRPGTSSCGTRRLVLIRRGCGRRGGAASTARLPAPRLNCQLEHHWRCRQSAATSRCLAPPRCCAAAATCRSAHVRLTRMGSLSIAHLRRTYAYHGTHKAAEL